jgi:hypothetical protein
MHHVNIDKKKDVFHTPIQCKLFVINTDRMHRQPVGA